MVTRAPRRSAIFAAVAFALSCVGLIIFVWTQFGGTLPFAPRAYELHARFRESGLLVPGADVRISGIRVGQVAAVQNRGVFSFVTMSLEREYAPVPADTRAVLRQKTLLGEAYVELSPGSRRARRFADGATIPSAHVQATQSLDQVLAAFDRPTQRSLQTLLVGTSAAVAGRGADLNAAIGNLDPGATDLRAIFDTLDSERGNLGQLIASGATITGTLARRTADLRTLISAGERVLSATAERNASLRATVTALPAFLGRLRTTLHGADQALSAAHPTLTALEPVTPLVVPALADLVRLSGPAVALLHEAPSLLAAANRTLPAITRFTRAFRPAVDVLLPAAREVVPLISFMSRYRGELATAMGNLAASLSGQAAANTPSGTASYLRAVPMIGNETVFGQSIREPTNRHNTYFSPGEMANLGRGGLMASDCANVSNISQLPLPTGNVPCRAQPPFDWGPGVGRSYFPRLTAVPSSARGRSAARPSRSR